MNVLTQPPRYVFCTPPWHAAFHAAMATCVAVAADPELSFSMSEASTNPPADLGLGGRAAGWACFVRDGRVERFLPEPAEDAAYRVEAAYEVMIDLCRFEVGGDPARAEAYQAKTRALWEAGAIRTIGSPQRLPKPFAAIHDTIARLTL